MSFDTGTFQIGAALRSSSMDTNTRSPTPFVNIDIYQRINWISEYSCFEGKPLAKMNHLHLGHLEHHIDKVHQQSKEKMTEMTETFKIVLTECFRKLEKSIGEVNDEVKKLATRIEKLEQQVLVVQEEQAARADKTTIQTADTDDESKQAKSMLSS